MKHGREVTQSQLPEGLRSAGKAARKAQWSIVFTGGNHLRWTPPAGPFVITPYTPRGGCRSNENSIRYLRQAGLKI